MLRRRGNLLSEDSISDEDVAELHNHQQTNFPNNVLSLQQDSANKIELPLPVRLDLLKGRICNQNSSFSFEKPLEDDEVEIPDFKDGDLHDVLGEVVADSSDEENVSEDEVSTVLSTRHLRKNGHPFIRNDQVKDTNSKPEALLRFKESASCSASRATFPKANASGVWTKAKPRLPFPSMSHKYGHNNHSMSNIDRLPEIMEAVDSRASASLDGNHLEDDDIMEVKSSTEPAETDALPCEFNHPSMAVDSRASASLDGNHLEDDDIMEVKSSTEPAETDALPCEFNRPSMADLFDELQDKTDLDPHDGQRRGKTVQLSQNKNSRSHFPDIVVDSEDSPEPVNSGSSSDNELSDQHMKLTFLGKKMQTMADRFQEALGSSSIITEGSNVGAVNKLGTRIFGKLQQVMQLEKERDMDFWKTLQAGARPDSKTFAFTLSALSIFV